LLEFRVGDHSKGREMEDFKFPKLVDGIKVKEFLTFDLESTCPVKVNNLGMEGVMDINKEGGDISFISTQF
jgi:hypothetical protein